MVYASDVLDDTVREFHQKYPSRAFLLENAFEDKDTDWPLVVTLERFPTVEAQRDLFDFAQLFHIRLFDYFETSKHRGEWRELDGDSATHEREWGARMYLFPRSVLPEDCMRLIHRMEQINFSRDGYSYDEEEEQDDRVKHCCVIS